MAQYRNTIADLAAWAVGGASARTDRHDRDRRRRSPRCPRISAKRCPQDLHGSYRRLDQSLQQIHVDATYDVAVALGAALTTLGAARDRGRRLRHRRQHHERRQPAWTRSSRSSARARCAARSTPTRSTSTRPPTAPAPRVGRRLRRPDRPVRSPRPSSCTSSSTATPRSPARPASTTCRRTSWRRACRTSCGRPRPTTRCWRPRPTARCSTPTVYDAQVDAPAGRSARAPGAGRVLRRLAQGRGSARAGREERRRRLQGVRGRRSARRQAAPGDDRRRARDARLLHLDGAVGRSRRCSPAISSFARDARLAQALRRARLGRHRGAARAARRAAPGPAHARAVPRRPARANTRPIMKGVFLRKNMLCDDDPAAAAGRQRHAARAGPGHDHARDRRGAHRDARHGLRRLPPDGDQPARLRDRELRCARPLPHRAAPVRRRGRRDRDASRSTRRRSRRSSTAIRPRSRRRRPDGADRRQRQGRGVPGAQLLPLHLRPLGGPGRDGCALEDAAQGARGAAASIADLAAADAEGGRSSGGAASSERTRAWPDKSSTSRDGRCCAGSAAPRWRCRFCRRCSAGRPTAPTRCSRAAAAVLGHHRPRRRVRGQHVPERVAADRPARRCSPITPSARARWCRRRRAATRWSRRCCARRRRR